jgi:hypothetical protein
VNDYPEHWFAKLERVVARPDMLTGVEMNTVNNLCYWRGPPSPAEAAMVERVYRRLEEDDGFQNARHDNDAD